MAHRWCAIRIAHGAQKKFKFFFRFFLNLSSLWLNLGSICLISGQITLRGQTSRKVTHPHTTPAQARLTSEFYPTQQQLTSQTLVDISSISILLYLVDVQDFVHVHDYDEILKNISNFPVILCINFWKKIQKKIQNHFFSVTSGAPHPRCATSKFEIFWIFLPLDLESPVTFFLLGFWGFWKYLTRFP